MKYIDVSEWQGIIDWEQVKGNTDGVIIRAGYGKKRDKYFDRNAAECNRLKIPCGAYWFSYAKTVADAQEEARQLIAAVKAYRMELPLAYDFEYDSVNNAKKAGVTVTKALCSEFVRAFCTAVEKAGYWCLNYANPDFLSRYFDASVTARFGLWLAQWPSKPDPAKPPRKCAIWQWGGSMIPGITPGQTVDTNEAYEDFRKIITDAGMNNLRPVYTEDDGSTTIEYTAQLPQPWYAGAMKWAEDAGLMTDGRPLDNLTRAEAATLLQRYDERIRNMLNTADDNKCYSGLLSD